MATKRLLQFDIDLKNDSITKVDGVSTGGIGVIDVLLGYDGWCVIPNYNGKSTLCSYTEVGFGMTIEINSSAIKQGQEIPVIDSGDEPLSIRLFGGRPRPPQK